MTDYSSNRKITEAYQKVLARKYYCNESVEDAIHSLDRYIPDGTPRTPHLIASIREILDNGNIPVIKTSTDNEGHKITTIKQTPRFEDKSIRGYNGHNEALGKFQVWMMPKSRLMKDEITKDFDKLDDAVKFLGHLFEKYRGAIDDYAIFNLDTEDGVGEPIDTRKYSYRIGESDDSADSLLKITDGLRVLHSNDFVIVKCRKGDEQDGYGIAAELGSVNGFDYNDWIDTNKVEVGKDFIKIPNENVGGIKRVHLKKW